MDNRFEVAVGAGTLMSGSAAAARFPHRWTPEGVTVEADFTGGHLLHLAAAGCVLNDVYREAARLGIDVKGVRVTAAGGFDTVTWHSTGIGYSVDVSSDAPPARLRIFSRSWTRLRRSRTRSGPEPSSGGCLGPDRLAKVPRSRPLSRDRTRCPRCPASRGTTRCRHRHATVARVPRRARPVVRIRPQVRPSALHPRARCRPARQDAADS
jgi:hypothetical protein